MAKSPPRSKPAAPSGLEDYQPPAPFPWEDRAVFRETFLLYVTRPGAADVPPGRHPPLRHGGRSCEEWPE